jgi:RNase P subunit RPR2
MQKDERIFSLYRYVYLHVETRTTVRRMYVNDMGRQISRMSRI